MLTYNFMVRGIFESNSMQAWEIIYNVHKFFSLSRSCVGRYNLYLFPHGWEKRDHHYLFPIGLIVFCNNSMVFSGIGCNISGIYSHRGAWFWVESFTRGWKNRFSKTNRGMQVMHLSKRMHHVLSMGIRLIMFSFLPGQVVDAVYIARCTCILNIDFDRSIYISPIS